MVTAVSYTATSTLALFDRRSGPCQPLAQATPHTSEGLHLGTTMFSSLKCITITPQLLSCSVLSCVFLLNMP